MKRRLERKQLRQRTCLTNAITGEDAGHVVDITAEGVMLEAPTPFDRNKVYILEMALPETLCGQTTLRLGMDCLWARPADHFRGHWAGFQIVDASPEAIEGLNALIEQYGI
ncbi:MAG: hypothetical protein EP312_05045 [Gammaproteobacteria bacterium]|nr:MAG: hypothetical protein EP312_05045 [Gammaproteobacteria bacterium]